jgi:hypothetical protein
MSKKDKHHGKPDPEKTQELEQSAATGATPDPTQTVENEKVTRKEVQIEQELVRQWIDDSVKKAVAEVGPGTEGPRPKPMVATVGRVVWYGFQGRAFPAVVTVPPSPDDEKQKCEVYVLWSKSHNAMNPQIENVEFSHEPKEECWSWPPRN